MTLRYNTKRPETTLYGVNVLAGAEKDKIVKSALMQAERYGEIRNLSFKNPLGDGEAGKRIAHLLRGYIEAGLTVEEPDLRETPVIEYRLLDKEGMFEGSLFDLLVGFDECGKPELLGKASFRLLARVKGKMFEAGGR